MPEDSTMVWRTGAELARSIRERVVSPVELMNSLLERIEARNPSLNAFAYLAHEHALAAARKAERAVMAGEKLGPLHGVPTAIKDLFDSKLGWPYTLGGIPALRDNPGMFTCVWAERIEAAGAIIIGKTNSPSMGFRGTCDNLLFGATCNPFDTSRNAGGSSGGAAAAVADGLLPFAEGTDGGGSIRIPAAWCSLVGFKPSWGRLPYTARPNGFIGTIPYVHEGLEARTAEDAALGLDVLAGYDSRDSMSLPLAERFVDSWRGSIQGMRVAFSPNLGGFSVAPEVSSVVAEAVGAFEEAGARVDLVDVNITEDQLEGGDLWCRMIMPANLQVIDELAQAGFDLPGAADENLPSEFLEFLNWADTATWREIAQDQCTRTAIYDAFEEILGKYDFVVCPTVAVLPVPNAERGKTVGPSEVNGKPVNPLIGWCLTYPVNFTGHPAASCPAGLSGGLPVGIQIIGRRYSDADVLAACGALERVRPWAKNYDLCEQRPLSLRNDIPAGKT